MPQSLTDEEFRALRRLLVDHAAELELALLDNLIRRRFVVAADDGHAVTLDGHAAFLVALGRKFDLPGAA